MSTAWISPSAARSRTRSRPGRITLARERHQRRRLAGNRVLLSLFVRRYPSVDRRGLHLLLPSPLRRQRSGPDQEPECRKLVRAWQRTAGRMRTPDGRHAVSAAAQPCRRFAARNAATACLTTSLVVTPRSLACWRRPRARLSGILSVIVTEG